MIVSRTTQRFLVAASLAAGAGDCFDWKTVGSTIGMSPAESSLAIRSLGESNHVTLLVGREARLLVAGRQIAAQGTSPDQLQGMPA